MVIIFFQLIERALVKNKKVVYSINQIITGSNSS